MKTSYLNFGNFRIGASLVVPFVSAIVGLQYGLNHGIGNHNTYLLTGLKMFRPDLFLNDWLVSQTTAYHPTFAYVVYLLYQLNPEGWGIAYANVITIAISVFFVYVIVAQLFDDPAYRLPVFLLATAFLCTTETYSVSGSYIFSRTFQPSSVSALCFLAGTAYFLKRKYVISGIVLAVGGVFHVNYLLLSIILFGLVHVVMNQSGLFKRLFRQLGCSILALATMSPLIIASSLSPDAALGRRLYQQINAPQHYLPLSYLTDFVPLGMWVVLSLVVGAPIMARDYLKREFIILFWIQVSLVAAATLLTTVVFIPAVSQMYFWRLAPYCVLFSLIIASGGLIHRLRNPQPFEFSLNTMAGVILALAGTVGIWYYHYGWYRKMNIILLLIAGLAWIVSIIVNRNDRSTERHRTLLVTSAAVIIGLSALLRPFSDFKRKSNLLTGFPEDEQALIDWAKSETSLDAVFLIPPSLNNFRLNARRAVIVDTKSPPVLPYELVQWYHRLEDISGVKGFTDKKVLDPGYRDIDHDRLVSLTEEYRFQYAVFCRDVGNDSTRGYEIAYSNPTWIVLTVR